MDDVRPMRDRRDPGCKQPGRSVPLSHGSATVSLWWTRNPPRPDGSLLKW